MGASDPPAPWAHRALALWLLFIAIESVLGALRAACVVPLVGDVPARRIGFFVTLPMIFALAWWGVRWMFHGEEDRGRAGDSRLVAAGLLWAGCTLAFEIALGRALGYSWSRIAEDYDATRGGLMAFGLAWLAAAPWVAARLRRRSATGRLPSRPPPSAPR